MKKIIFTSSILIVIFCNVNAQWVQTSLQSPNWINCIEASGNNVLAGSSFGGLYFSSNNASSWTNTGNSLGLGYDIYDIVLNGNNVYAGAGAPDGNVYYSANNGSNWSVISNGITSEVLSIAVDGTNIFAGTYSGIFLSSNNGTNWVAVNNGLPSNASISTIAIAGSNIFAGSYQGGIYLSSNNGSSWTAVSNGLPIDTAIFGLAVNGNNIYAGTNYGGIYLSTDNGNSWNDVNNGLPLNIAAYDFAFIGSNVFAATISGVYYSANNGISWTEFNTGLNCSYVSAIATNGINLYAATCDPNSEGSIVWKRPLSEVGINELNGFTSAVSVYPNPAKDEVTIVFSDGNTEECNVEIFDIAGKLIASKTLNAVNNFTLNTSSINNGIYLCKINVNGFSKGNQKLIIVK